MRLETLAEERGRVTAISSGEFPTTPAQDHRFGFAILGACVGLLAFVVLRLVSGTARMRKLMA